MSFSEGPGLCVCELLDILKKNIYYSILFDFIWWEVFKIPVPPAGERLVDLSVGDLRINWYVSVNRRPRRAGFDSSSRTHE